MSVKPEIAVYLFRTRPVLRPVSKPADAVEQYRSAPARGSVRVAVRGKQRADLGAGEGRAVGRVHERRRHAPARLAQPTPVDSSQ